MKKHSHKMQFVFNNILRDETIYQRKKNEEKKTVIEEKFK